MRLAEFGASGPTGRQVVGQALAAGHRARAVTRRPDEFPLTAPGLEVVAGDVTNRADVEQAIAGVQAVISTFGVPYGRREITVYSRGIAAIVVAMTAHGIDRLVCVSSSTLAREEAPAETLFWRKVLVPVLRNVVGRTLYDDMQRMADVVRSSSLDWTIVRPAGLFDTAAPTGDYEVAPWHLAGRNTSRADLAETLLREATAPRHSRSIIEIITRTARPSAGAFIKEMWGARQ